MAVLHNVLTTPQLLPTANNNGNAEYAILNLSNESHCLEKKEINIAGDFPAFSREVKTTSECLENCHKYCVL